jgi:hypothetical protein
MEFAHNPADYGFKRLTQYISVADKYPRQQHGVERLRPSAKPALDYAQQFFPVNERGKIQFLSLLLCPPILEGFDHITFSTDFAGSLVDLAQTRYIPTCEK